MTIKDAREILAQNGIEVYTNHASFGSSRRGIHGGATYRVYLQGATEPTVMTLAQVRQLAHDTYFG